MKSSRLLSVAALAVASLLTLPQPARAADQPEQSAAILNGSAAVQALSYVYYTVSVAPVVMTNPHIVGHVEAIGGSGNDIDVMVFSQTDFTNWKNNHSVAPLYNSGQVTAADVNVPVAAGDYVVVLSNTFSAFTPKTVAGSLRLAWTPPPPPSALDKLAGNAGLLVIFLVVFAAVLMGGLVWWALAQQEKKKAAAAVKKPA